MGQPPGAVADFGCGLDAALPGLCAGEVGGLLARPPPLSREVRGGGPGALPARHRLPDTPPGPDPDALFARTLAARLGGIENAAGAGRGHVAPTRR